jgi:tRNA A37 threonylcarbamoyladenosine dehydratase
MKKAFQSIAPWVEVDARVELFQEDCAEELLSGERGLPSRAMKISSLGAQ